MEICIVRNDFKPLNHFENIPKCSSAVTTGTKSLCPKVEQRPVISNGETILANQRGVALIISLIMLIVLTLIGLSSIGTSIFETKISGHDRFASNAFYAATGGLEVGINQIPDVTAYSGNIGPDETYRSGRITDSSPQPLKNLGLALKPGYETSFEFKRFQVSATGFSFGAQKEIEAQILLGPYPAGTSYNN